MIFRQLRFFLRILDLFRQNIFVEKRTKKSEVQPPGWTYRTRAKFRAYLLKTVDLDFCAEKCLICVIAVNDIVSA